MVPVSVWTPSTTCDGSTCPTNLSSTQPVNLTLRLVLYRDAILFPVRRPDCDVITDVITIAVGQ